MPEGDVVLRTAMRLDRALSGRALVAAEVRWPTASGAVLAGRTVLETVARGKHLLTRFDDGRTLHTHLRMDGSWWVGRTPPEGRRLPALGRDVRVALAGPEWTCEGRRLGMVDLVRTRDEGLVIGHLGPDLLAEAWDRDRAVANLDAQGGRGVGEALLDQGVVAGIGTIYLAETLWAHGVWPWEPVRGLVDAGALLDTARALMLRSVAARLPTATGDPDRPTRVHGRRGKPCPRCGSAVAEGRVGRPPLDRPAFYCPTCQAPAG